MTTPSTQFDRSLEQITTHLHAHLAELRRLEQTGATASELEERRELVARLQGHLARLVRTALAPPEPPSSQAMRGPSPQRHAPHSRSRSGRVEHQGACAVAVAFAKRSDSPAPTRHATAPA